MRIQFHRIDHQSNIGGVLASSRQVVLNRSHAIMDDHFLPALHTRVRPIAIDSTNGKTSKLACFREKRDSQLSREILTVNEQSKRKHLNIFSHSIRLVQRVLE